MEAPGPVADISPRPAVTPPAAIPRPADPAVDPVAVTNPPAPPPLPPTPSSTSAFASNEIGFRLVGVDASAISDSVAALARAQATSNSVLLRFRFVPSARAEPPLEGARAVIAIEANGLRVGRVSPPPLEADVIAALMPPLGLAGDVLSGALLPVGDRGRTVALAALTALLAGDADACLALLEGAGEDAGVRVLGAYAHLARKELSSVHAGVLGLGTRADVGAVARFLTGSALLADGNPREALRDFAAAIEARPSYWPARLLAGTANDRLNLPEAARDQFAAVLAAVPGRPEAVIGYAPHLAETDRAAAVALVEKLLVERPALVPGWWQLAWLRRKGDTSEDLQQGVEALKHVVALRPGDADAWGALGVAHSRWASGGGGVEAYRAAAAAFAKQCELTPDDGLAWFGQAAMLHEVAFKAPLGGDAGALAQRVSATAAIYVKALARGMPRPDLARVHFNLGLLLDAVTVWPEGSDPSGLPRRSAEAYAAALDADAGYAEAGMKLLAARIGDRDVKEAMKALSTLPPGIDLKERAVLEAALAHVKGDPAGAVRQLTGPGRTTVAGADPLTPLAKELLLLDYRRLAVTLLSNEARDPARIVIRARARAGLGDVTGTTADLALLRTLDAPRADDLRRNDADVRRTLGELPAR